MTLITKPQIVRLQTLYYQWERHSLDCPGPSREQRIAWASQQTGRAIKSFSQLTLDEGKRLIDLLQNAVGHKHPAKKRQRKPATRASRNQGTAGRRDQEHAETTMVGEADIARIQRDLELLGWDQARLEAYLRSSRSPLQGATAIRTLAQANKLHWALKRIHTYRQRTEAAAS